MIAYLSTINPPRPFFIASDLTLSTNQSLSLKYPRLLSFSTDSLFLLKSTLLENERLVNKKSQFFHLRICQDFRKASLPEWFTPQF
ncbi:predicted protein [Enterococcus casseliflavus EC10]|nr:predicted protein [Enterococcus casseliflavus EC10]